MKSNTARATTLPPPTRATGAAISSLTKPSAVALAAVVFLFAGYITWQTRSSTTKGTDFFYYYVVSKMVVQGHGSDIYRESALGAQERSMARPTRVPGGVIPNNYPPFFALALAPLALLPYQTAYLLWLGLNCALLVAVLIALERYLQLGSRARWVFRVAAVLSLPVIVALLQGQTSFILLAAFTAFFLLWRAGRDTLAGVALGATLIKPQFALAILLMLLVQTRWRAITSFCLTALVLFLTPIAVFHWAALPDYVHALRTAATYGASVGGFAPKWNRSFEGFLALLLPAAMARSLSLILDLAALLGLTFFVRRVGSTDIALAMAVIVALLTSQHVLIHDLALLVLPAVIVLGSPETATPGRPWILGGLYLAVLVGFELALIAPFQLATVAMTATAAWLFLTIPKRPGSLTLATT